MVDCLTITPALALELVLLTEVTRATIEPLAAAGWST